MNAQKNARGKWYCPRPWVVLDWGVLRSLPSGAGIPGKFTAVIPDRVVAEVLGSTSPSAFLKKLDGIFSHPDSRDRVLVGRYWNDIALEETRPSDVQGGLAPAINDELSSLLRDRQEAGTGVFLAEEDQPEVLGFDDRKVEFVDLMKRYVEWMASERSDRLKEIASRGISHRIQLIRQSDGMEKLVAHASKRYRKRAWKKVLRAFPDRCAIGRWFRLIAWYAMKHAAAPDTGEKKLGNDYDDVHYAFLSLYTKHIWTLDSGMSEAVRAVSANRVRVHKGLTSIPTY